MRYVHPSYSYQLIYFNDARDKMIEQLNNYRAFLYRKV